MLYLITRSGAGARGAGAGKEEQRMTLEKEGEDKDVQIKLLEEMAAGVEANFDNLHKEYKRMTKDRDGLREKVEKKEKARFW